MNEASSWKRKIAGFAAGLGIYASVHDKPEASSIDNKPVPVTQKFHTRENIEPLPPLMTAEEKAKSDKYDREYEAAMRQKQNDEAWAKQEAAEKYIPTNAQKQLAEEKYKEIENILENEEGGLHFIEFPMGGNLNEFCKNLDMYRTFFSRDAAGILHIQKFEGMNEDGTPKISDMMEVQIDPQENGANEYSVRSGQRFGENNTPLYEEIITDPNQDVVGDALFRYYGMLPKLEPDGKVQYEQDIDPNKSDADIMQDLEKNIHSIHSFFRFTKNSEGAPCVALNQEARNELNNRVKDYQEQLDDLKKVQVEATLQEM